MLNVVVQFFLQLNMDKKRPAVPDRNQPPNDPGHPFFHKKLHPECFNLVVRKLASAELERTAGTNWVGSKHYFDLQFHAQSQALRYSWMTQGERITTLINYVVVQPLPKYDVFNSIIVRDAHS